MLQPMTEVILTWQPDQEKTAKTALCFVVEDMVNAGSADLVLVVKWKNVGYFREDSVPSTKYQEAKEYDVRLSVVDSGITYHRRMDAVHLVWDVERGHRILWPVLLKQDPYSLPTTNAFELAGVSEEDAAKALREYTTDFTSYLNKEQEQFLKGVLIMVAAFLIIEAAGGMGKTRIEIILSLMFASVGVVTIMTAPTNTAVDRICEEYAASFPKRPQPISVLASTTYDEDELLGKVTKRRDGNAATNEDSDTVMASLIDQFKRSDTKTRSLVPDNDLLTVSIHRAKNGLVQVLGQYNDKNGNPYGETVDMAKEFKHYLELAHNPDEKPHAEWDPEDRGKYRQCLRAVQADVLANTPVVVSTTVNAGSSMIRQNAGRNFKGLIHTIDEAPRDREADTYIP
ncbi:uncharacterized protein K452DRAFT_127674 [Aplosporella prunicola CBS 121167]|uniref:DNA2/NAM7 helicase helicase domain-containing protein n=1 Tax=Aplosporella prunicola CBS 121167 TaxID=1176127 RepID=A0A6A6AXE3_9PEZI|nr:uncharacterized protein K452DRAFT_127674 [Aplosporella prunicola CBS 121167]KAF2136632.1 hypothetical protein K452DRAFT_127674 [Aplosporella prunicola CBS 121167]